MTQPSVRTPFGRTPILPLGLLAIGAYFAWFGIHYWRTDTKWPSDPVKADLTGKPIPAAKVDNTAADAVAQAAASVAQAGTTVPGLTPPGPAAGGSNQTLGRQLATAYGWHVDPYWTALVNLWNRESSWDNHASNPSSGAYGIPQALPYTKMPKPAWPESAGGQSDAASQINWGLGYIWGRYHDPTTAWAHELANNWY